jgi:hypothetical protein
MQIGGQHVWLSPGAPFILEHSRQDHTRVHFLNESPPCCSFVASQHPQFSFAGRGRSSSILGQQD